MNQNLTHNKQIISEFIYQNKQGNKKGLSNLRKNKQKENCTRTDDKMLNKLPIIHVYIHDKRLSTYNLVKPFADYLNREKLRVNII